jgi:general secretion pathway protein K
MRVVPSKRRQQGIALILVLISVVVLGVLAAGFAWSMRVEVKLARNASSERELEWLGRSGVELARYVLGQQLLIGAEPYD